MAAAEEPGGELSGRAEAGARELLALLGDADLRSLMDTVVMRRVVAEDREECVEAIVTFSEDAAGLLRRQKVKKDVIFHYLVRSGVAAMPSMDKAALVAECVRHWQAPAAEEEEVVAAEVPAPALPPHEATALAQNFAHQFFAALQHAQCDRTHFFDACNVSIRTTTLGGEASEAFSDSHTTTARLLHLRTSQGLILNPNPGSVSGQLNEFGLLCVRASGTLHQGAHDVGGLFVSEFGLCRDPTMANNWRIKALNLQMREKGAAIAPPALEGS